MIGQLAIEPVEGKHLPPGALGVGGGKVGVSQQLLQQCRDKLAADRPLAAGIVTGPLGVMAAIPAVEQGIGRAGIKAIDAVCLTRQHRDIGDAAEVQHHPQGARFGKNGLMEGGHQRRPLTAEGHVHGAKIGHHIDAGQRRQQGRVADLQGKAELGTVADGLAVAAEGANIFGSQPRFGQQGVGGGGKLAGDQVVGHPHAVDLVVARGAEGVQLVRGGPRVAESRLDPQ